MRLGKNELTAERVIALLERHWKWVTLLSWLLFCAWSIAEFHSTSAPALLAAVSEMKRL
jgi:hypothetical protein